MQGTNLTKRMQFTDNFLSLRTETCRKDFCWFYDDGTRICEAVDILSTLFTCEYCFVYNLLP